MKSISSIRHLDFNNRKRVDILSAHLGLDALEEIISCQSHGDANCGLDQAHQGEAIAGRRLALVLSHRYSPSISAQPNDQSSRLHVKPSCQRPATSIVTFKTNSTEMMTES